MRAQCMGQLWTEQALSAATERSSQCILVLLAVARLSLDFLS